MVRARKDLILVATVILVWANLPEHGATNCDPITAKNAPAVSKYLLSTDSPENGVCIAAEFAAQVKIGDSLFIPLHNGRVDQHYSACPDTIDRYTARLAVNFDCASIIFQFKREDYGSPFSAVKVQVSVDNDKYTDHPIEGMSTKDVDRAYRCDSEQEFVLRPGSDASVSLLLSHVIIEPYRDPSKTDLHLIQDVCAADKTHMRKLLEFTMQVAVLIGVLVACVFMFKYYRYRREQESELKASVHVNRVYNQSAP